MFHAAGVLFRRFRGHADGAKPSRQDFVALDDLFRAAGTLLGELDMSVDIYVDEPLVAEYAYGA